MTFKHTKLIHFDFDGVIIDSFKISFEIWQSFIPEAKEEDYRMYFAGNVYESIRMKPSMPLEEIKPKWSKHYDKRVQGMFPIPGMESVVSRLSKSFIMNIVTSSAKSSVEKFLCEHRLQEAFEEILGFEFHESKHEKIQHLLLKHEVAPQHSVIITDTLGDILEAAKVGVPAIAVTWGFHNRKLLQEGNPAAIVDSPEELIKLFE